MFSAMISNLILDLATYKLEIESDKDDIINEFSRQNIFYCYNIFYRQKIGQKDVENNSAGSIVRLN